jgi:hypothetical protein
MSKARLCRDHHNDASPVDGYFLSVREVATPATARNSFAFVTAQLAYGMSAKETGTDSFLFGK